MAKTAKTKKKRLAERAKALTMKTSSSELSLDLCTYVIESYGVSSLVSVRCTVHAIVLFLTLCWVWGDFMEG